MSLNFNEYAEKGSAFVNLVANELQVPHDRAGRILQAVLHTLRDTLPIEESLQLLAQLPMMIKAVYVDRWRSATPIKGMDTVASFIGEVRNKDGSAAAADLGSDEQASHAIKNVFRVLSLYVTEGELEDIIAALPKDLKGFLKDSVERKSTL